ncbi:unnamed protein product [Calypogeia fissa]
MGIPGVLGAFPTICSSPRSPLSVNSAPSAISSPSSPSSSSSCDRRRSSLSSSTSFGGTTGTSLFFKSDTRNAARGRALSKLKNGNWRHEATELRLVVCVAQESGTLSKEAAAPGGGDDGAMQSATTIHGEDVQDGQAAGAAPSRPKRFDFNYGFQAKFLRTGPTVPGNVFKLAFENFGREWRALRRSYLFRELKTINPSEFSGNGLGLVGEYTGRGFLLFVRGVDKFLTVYDGLREIKPVQEEGNEERNELRAKLKQLVLSNDAVWERERSRPAVEAPWWILGPYYFLCLMLDVIFNNRPIQRFWFLETVARMPYFSYISMLHLYETLGWWRSGAEVRKVHFAEEWNEMHHLKIMESLGGDIEWGDRFFGQHAAFFYYWILNGMFLVSPTVAYNFSELIEAHAVDTYGEFADANEELLKTLPPPPVAVAYYESKDLYMYDEFQTSQLPEARRPKMNSLHDVFLAICGDEGEHVKTMVACQQLDTQVKSPHRGKR